MPNVSCEARRADNCVWLDLNATNPAERLKYLTCWTQALKEQRVKGISHSLPMSDGVTWSDAAAAVSSDPGAALRLLGHADAGGASHGYLRAGGPDYAGVRDEGK